MGSVGKRTVCVVEDEPFARMDAVLLLEEAGFEPVARWATWDREPFEADSSTYAVSVHVR